MLAIRIAACLAGSAAGFGAAWKLSHPSKKRPLLALGLAFTVAFIIFGGKVLPGGWALRWEEFTIGGVGGQALLAVCIPVVGVLAMEIVTSSRLIRCLILALMSYAYFQQVWFGVLDSLCAVPQLSRLETRLSPTGVCIQTTGYTCGPAAAVTALKHLGYTATESQIGLASETGKYYGTDEFRLARAMNQVAPVLHCHVAQFRSVDELRGLPPVLVIINLTTDVAHYIVIYSFDGKWLEYADPLSGRGRMRRENLESKWTGRGIICGPG